jgi:hypothetical protein
MLKLMKKNDIVLIFKAAAVAIFILYLAVLLFIPLGKIIDDWTLMEQNVLIQIILIEFKSPLKNHLLFMFIYIMYMLPPVCFFASIYRTKRKLLLTRILVSIQVLFFIHLIS